MKKTETIFLVLFIVLIFIGCRSQEKSDFAQPDKIDSLLTLNNNEKLYAILDTDFGIIEIELFPFAAPRTVRNFVSLSEEGYYNGVIFHRVIKGFMIQTGDSTGTGMGGKSIYGEAFEDEFSADLKHDSPGTVSMANSGPNTNKSQFFITVAATPWLNLKHTVFGKVRKGQDIVEKISLVPTNENDRPVIPVSIKNVTVEKRKY
ncbi:peptidylprolyl isomerase [Melioribacter sp. OK-6-Me]|uniref:peptidylprolyl isomerase n=1 Tax=unclassified Melioribacter TaxID=2627329 RepID=UPI003EDAA2B4